MSASTQLPPLAPGLPFVGSILALANDAQDFFYTQYRELGQVFRVRAMGQEFKVLAGPEINMLMATQAEAFSAWDTWAPVVRDFGGKKTIAMLDGPDHARMRRLMRQSFSRDALLNQLPMVIDLITTFTKKHALQQPIPVAHFMQYLTANILGQLSNERLPEDHFDDIVLWWTTLMEVYLSHLKPPSVLQKPKYQRARDRVKDFARAVFRERQAHRPADDEDNFLDNLAQASTQDPDFLSHDEALFLTLAGYFAGLDTVANVSAFMLYELLRHPAILEATRQEADQAFATGTPTAEAFRRMPTLHAVALEALRLYPVAGVLPRTATRDLDYAGYTIPKGEQFMIATAAPHFASEFYKDPYTFDIERYREPRNEHKKRGVFAPFGAGPHTCLGAGLAEVQIMVTLATLLHQAEFTLHPLNYKMKKVYTPSMTPKGFEIKLTAWRGA